MVVMGGWGAVAWSSAGAALDVATQPARASDPMRDKGARVREACIGLLNGQSADGGSLATASAVVVARLEHIDPCGYSRPRATERAKSPATGPARSRTDRRRLTRTPADPSLGPCPRYGPSS